MKTFGTLPLLLFVACTCRTGTETTPLITAPVRAHEPFDTSELGPCVTIDETAGNEALTLLRDAVSGEDTHGSAQKATTNLQSCVSTSTNDIAIGGHGAAGSIITGGGPSFSDTSKLISAENVDDWRSFVDNNIPDRGGILSLLSCNTGSGPAGAALLKELATLTQRTVRARTGLVYCGSGGISFEANSIWKEAAPGEDVQPTDRPKPPHLPFTIPTSLTLGKKTFPVTSIESVTLSLTVGGDVEQLRRVNPPSTFDFNMLRLIDFEHPFTPPGEPLAPVTAQVEMEFRNDPVSDTRILWIYADVLARDMGDPKVFFDVDPALTNLLVTARR